MAAPPIGWSTPCEIKSIIDGDTVDVIVSRRIRVRLLDCWAPETRGEEKQAGDDAKQALVGLLMKHGAEAVLHIPASQRGVMADSMTFSRALGNVWLDGMGQSLSEWMVENGYATKEPGNES